MRQKLNYFFFFSSRSRHTRFDCDWSSDVCSSDLGGGGGFNPLNLIGGLLGAAPSGPPAPGRVRVVAEKSSNSLIVVKASMLDLLTMRKLLANVIDSGETDSDAVQKTFVLKLKNTDASEMATTV